jgi:signal transduction histidine kinase
MTTNRAPRSPHWKNVAGRPSLHEVVRRMTAEAQDIENVWDFWRVLGHVGRDLDASACIIWELTPQSDLEARPPKGWLLVLAQWFAERMFAIAEFSVQVNESLAGIAITQGSVELVSDVRETERLGDLPFLTAAGIGSVCAIPIKLADSTQAALSIYRSENAGSFTSDEVARAVQLAALVTVLHNIVQTRVDLRVVAATEKILTRLDDSQSDEWPRDQASSAFQRVVRMLDESFQCDQIAIYLKDALEAPGVFRQIAVTQSPAHLSESAPYPHNGDSLGNWVLTHGRSLNLPAAANEDLATSIIAFAHPGLNWDDPHLLRDIASARHPTLSGTEHPILSFTAVPVSLGLEILGLIRCVSARRSPYHLSKRDTKILELVATQIGHYWRQWLAERDKRDESRAWEAVVAATTRLNRVANDEFLRDEPDLRRLYGEALVITRELVRGADSVDVRLITPDTNELYWFETGAEAWPADQSIFIDRFKQRRWKLSSDMDMSAGARVVRTQRVELIANVDVDPAYSQTFDGVTWTIIAPIASSDTRFGVLDIRSTHQVGWPKYAEEVAKLIGQQLGLYHQYLNTSKRLDTTRQVQLRTFIDLKHQMNGPIHQALQLLDELVHSTEHRQGPLHRRLLQVRGIFRKLRGTVTNVDLFTAMATDAPIRIALAPGLGDYIVKLLVEAAQDGMLIIDAYRDIRIQVERDSFEQLPLSRVWADRQLFEQAINCVIDNAVKYSYSGTIIRIFGHMTIFNSVQIIVRNIGLPISQNETHHCKEYGWRGHAAMQVTGEGSGIGLWIVNHIMKAHGGNLVVYPTNTRSETEVIMEFPLRER